MPALAFAIALAPALPAGAGSVSASLSVTVVVPPRALLSVEAEPSSLEITETDLARGFVEVPGRSRIRVRTNDLNGWLLQFQIAPGPYRSIEVTGLGAPTQVSAGGGWLAQPYPGQSSLSADLGYRFVLSADARPGVYVWPVALSAVPR